jgi:hypothetical protein
MVHKLQLIFKYPCCTLTNVEAAQRKQFHTYATYEGKQLFAGLQVESWVKMRWPVKKKGWNGLGKLLTSL